MDSFGQRFRLDIFGASHAPCVGVTLHGVPATLPLEPGDFTADLRRRLGLREGKQLRIIPHLEFYLDDSLDYIENIERLLKQ